MRVCWPAFGGSGISLTASSYYRDLEVQILWINDHSKAAKSKINPVFFPIMIFKAVLV